MDEKRLEKIQVKIDEVHQVQYEIKESLVRIDTTLEHNHQNWVQHMARTEANERIIDELKDTFTKHLGFVKGATWVIGTLWLCSIAVAGLALRVFL